MAIDPLPPSTIARAHIARDVSLLLPFSPTAQLNALTSRASARDVSPP